jgi:hypothetical protein
METKRRWNSPWLAGALWVTPILIITIMIAVELLNRGVTSHYHLAVTNWWLHQPVYVGSKGFNYLPAFILFFSFFDWLPHTLCEILWRWVAAGGLFIGLWFFSGVFATKNRYQAFIIVTLLSLPLGVSALRNGQSSAHLAASLVLAAWYLHNHRLWWATFWLSMALVCKPLAIPAIGLAAVMFPGLWWRVAIGATAVFVCPYLFAPVNYVNEIYASFAANLTDCFDPSGPSKRTFADLNGLLAVFNIRLSGLPSLVVGAATGVAMAIGGWFVRGSGAEIRSVMLWLALSGIHIMLFTPMNESNSYVMLSPSFGLWALWFLANGQKRLAQVIAAMSLTMLFLPDLVGIAYGRSSGNEFAKFLYPLMTLFFLGILLPQIQRMISRIPTSPRSA